MKKNLLILLFLAFGSTSAFSMCAPVACTQSYSSTADAICNGPVITQDGACVAGDNSGSFGCLSGSCAVSTYHQYYMTFTATSTSVIIDFTSTGIQDADVALITNGAGGCGDPVSVCPAVGSLCVESCNTSVGGGSLSINPTTLTIGETYTLMIQSFYYEEFDGGVSCGTAISDAGTFNICITTDPCRDGIQNNGETGVDCGGTCGPCAATNDACVDDILLGINITNPIGSGATNTCTQTLCTDAATEDCCIATGMALCGSPTGCCLISYMSCGSVENNTWFTYTPPTTGTYNFALTNQSCTNGDGMQMWLGTMPSGCGDACSYNEIYCQSSATTADINYAAALTAGVTYYVSLDGFAGDDCTFDFGVYTNNPLPIELIDYSGNYKSKENAVLLEWQTSTEINNDFFTVERSYDGLVYEVIETVDGAGNSKNTLSYSLKDENPKSGTSYYRLQQTDFDGASSTTGVVAVNVSDKGDIKLFPTATASNVNLEMFMGAPTYTEITVYNAVGVLVFMEKIELGKGMTSFVIPSSDFDAGIYFVRINGIDTVDGNSLKFIKN